MIGGCEVLRFPYGMFEMSPFEFSFNSHTSKRIDDINSCCPRYQPDMERRNG